MAWVYGLGVWLGRMAWAYGWHVWFASMICVYASAKEKGYTQTRPVLPARPAVQVYRT